MPTPRPTRKEDIERLETRFHSKTMKILKLTLENINSIRGKWEINFEALEYASGIFAITGPTGAGKTSVLDAMCLSLYGRTPRLPTISTSTNEVMNRESEHCMASLEFETNQKKYRSSWSQKRAKVRSEKGSPFSPAKVTLEELDQCGNWSLLANNVTQKAHELDKITHLSFEQFTRSVLLAQNGFAAFLNAKAAEKAETLEQLTGTEIYSQISAEVFQLTKKKEQEFESEKSKLAFVEVLKPEERAAFEASLESNRKELKELEQKTTSLLASSAWLRELEELRKKLEHSKLTLAELQSKKLFMGELSQKINLAEKSEKIAYLLETFQEKKTKEGNTQLQLKQVQKELESARQKEQETKQKELEVAKALQTQKEKEETNHVLYTRVLELDAQIKSVLGKNESLTEENSKARKQLDADRKCFSEIKEKIDALCQKLNKLSESVAADTLGAGFNLHRAWISSQYTKIESNASKLADYQKVVEEKKTELVLKEKEIEAAAKELQKLAKAQEIVEKEISSLREQQNDLLNNRSIKSLEEEKNSLEKEEDRLSFLCRELKSLEESKTELAELLSDYDKRQQDISGLSKEILGIQNSIEKSKSLEEAWRLLVQIDEGTKLRALLEPGKPCPVCGALDHPYALHLPEEVKEARHKLREVENDLKKGEKELDEKAKELSSAKGIQKARGEEIKNLKAKIQKRERDLASLLPEALSQLSPVSFMQVNALQIEKKQKAEDIRALLMTINELSGRLEKKEDEQKALSESLSAKKIEKGSLTAAIDVLKQEAAKFEQKKSEIKRLDKAFWEEVRDKFCSESLLSSLSLKEEKPQTLLTWLAGADAYVKKLEEKKEAEQLLLQMKSKERSEEEKVERSEADFQNKRDKLEKGLIEIKKLQAARIEIFGTKSVTQEKKAEQEALGNLSQLREKLLGDHTNASSLVAGLSSKKALKEKELKELRSEVGSALDNWLAALKAQDFKQEADWRAARRTPEEVARDKREYDEYIHNLTGARALFAENEQQLKSREKCKLTDRTLEVLESELLQVKRRSDELNAKNGAAEEKLCADDKNRQTLKVVEDRLSALKDQLNVWRQLNNLIGSATGNKYREFVQSLVLISLLNNANIELRKLSSRYVLTK